MCVRFFPPANHPCTHFIHADTFPVRRQYTLYYSLGPGGFLPHSFFGWLIHNLILWPISLPRSATTGTSFLPPADLGRGHEPNLLGEGKLPVRRGARRPRIKGVVPHRCLEGGGDETRQLILNHLHHLSNLHPTILTLGSSKLERSPPSHPNALFHHPSANNSAPSPLATHYLSLLPSREICHVHDAEESVDEGSLHCLLSPADAHEVIKAGWGELHPLAGFGKKGFWWPPTVLLDLARLPIVGTVFSGGAQARRWGRAYPPVLTNRGGGSRGLQKLPPTYLMIYPARDGAEVAAVKQIVEASVGFATGFACGTVARGGEGE